MPPAKSKPSSSAGPAAAPNQPSTVMSDDSDLDGGDLVVSGVGHGLAGCQYSYCSFLHLNCFKDCVSIDD